MTSMSDDEDQRPEAAVDDDVNITIADQQHSIDVDENWVAEVARLVLRDEGVSEAVVSIALVDDATIHDVNRTFLGHDCPTDVISFLLSDEQDRTGRFDAEIIISAETAMRAALEFQSEPHNEVALYLVHGLLHLVGYDDHSAEDRRRMRDRERSHLQKFGIQSTLEG